MSVEDAQKTIDTTYNKRLFGSDVTICRSDEVLTAVLNGEKVEDLEGEDVSVDEAAAAQQTWKTDATTLQANVNAEELAYEALEVGRSDGGIFKRVGAFLFGNTVSPNLNFNDSAIEELAKDIDKTMGDVRVNYGVKVSDGVAAVTEGHDGNMVSRVWLKRTLNDQFTSADSSHAFVAEISYAPLQIDQEQAQACADTINTALNRGATLTFEGTSYDIDAASLGKWVKTSVNETSDEATPEEEKTYEIVPYLNVDKARSAILKHLTPSMDKEKAQVKIKVSGDTATVYPNAEGTMPVLADAVESLDAALFQNAEESSDPVTIEVQGTEIPESMSFDDALAYGVIEKVQSYTTEYTADNENRNINIHLAADLLNNSVCEGNGGTWSFNGTAGECNEEKGFVGAGTIVNGETVDEIGGGICQVATTVFNAVYEGGYGVVTRHNHTLYITSYPAGRDAAVSWPDLDFVWENDTSSDVLLRTSYTDTTVTVTLYGINPNYRVETETGNWKAGKKHKTVTEKDDTLAKGTEYVKQSGWDGSKITVKRTVYDDSDTIVYSDTFASVYDPRNEIVVKGTATS